MIEHPNFKEDMIPEGWERVTEGDARSGDQILVTGSSGSQFAPWVANDGKDVAAPGGTTFLDEEVVHCKRVVIRDPSYKRSDIIYVCTDSLIDPMNILGESKGFKFDGKTAIYMLPDLDAEGYYCSTTPFTLEEAEISR